MVGRDLVCEMECLQGDGMVSKDLKCINWNILWKTSMVTF